MKARDLANHPNVYDPSDDKTVHAIAEGCAHRFDELAKEQFDDLGRMGLASHRSIPTILSGLALTYTRLVWHLSQLRGRELSVEERKVIQMQLVDITNDWLIKISEMPPRKQPPGEA